MTHYDITIANDVARDVHCNIIMGHGVVMGTYHDVTLQTDFASMLLECSLMYYYAQLSYSIFLLKSLKLYIKH